jgi:hypothetical protein
MNSVRLTIDHTKVGADLSDFVLYVRLSDLGEFFWRNVASGGGDIRCHLSDGTELAREVVSCDTGTKTGELWVRVPSVSSSVDTEVVVSFGSGASDYAANDTYGSRAAWPSKYKFVGHFEDVASDSSANAVSVTSSHPAGASGSIGNGLLFNGSTDYAKLPASSVPRSSLQGGFTFQAIINPTTLGEGSLGRIIDVTDTSTNRLLWYLTATNKLRIYANNGIFVDSPAAYSFGAFTSVAVKVTSAGLVTFYANGAPIGTPASLTALSNLAFTHDVYVGNSEDKTRTFAGILDEVRICSEVSSDELILAEYSNQFDPAAFYSVERVFDGIGSQKTRDVAEFDGSIRLYDRLMNPLTTLTISGTSVSDFNGLKYRSALNETGDASFLMRLDNPKTTAANLKSFNRVEVCDGDGSVRWAGIITKKKVGLDTVSVSCLSLENLLEKRVTADEKTFTAVAAGSIASQLLADANSEEDTLISAGTCDATAVLSESFRLGSVMSALQTTADAAEAQFRVTTAGVLEFRNALGSDLSQSVVLRYDIAMPANSNVLGFDVDDDGTVIVTKTHGSAGTLSTEQEDASLRAEYGLIEGVKDGREADNQATLNAIAASNNRGTALTPSLALAPTVPDAFEVADTVYVRLKNRLVSVEGAYQVIEKAVSVINGQKQITITVGEKRQTLAKIISDLRKQVSLLSREV